LHIGINGYFWGQETTGSGQYLRGLLGALATWAPGDIYTLFAPRPADRERPAALLAGLPNARLVELATVSSNENLSKLWFEQIAFPRACRAARVDLAHAPYFASALLPQRPTVVTVHDLIPLLLPAYRGDARVRAYMRLVSCAARRAALILTDSEASRRDILRLLRAPAERVRVIYLAAEAHFRPAEHVQLVSALKRKHALPECFLLYLGGFDQRKNIAFLLRAFAEALKAFPADQTRPRLVLAGQLPREDSDFAPDPRRMIREWGLEGSVQCIGRVSEEDKPLLYAAAEWFVFPSLYEGFGLPVLEAMSCGAPVIVSSTSSLPEIVGEGGILADPTDVEAWAEALVRGWSQPERRAALRERALKQAAQFSWTKAALETRHAYQQAFQRRVIVRESQ
jgi:glycosyltransferase involved in cell wall biosynthesis